MDHIENSNKYKGLSVKRGVKTNKKAASLKTNSVSSGSRLSVAEFTQGILSGNKVVLSRAITLIESTLASDRILAREITDQCFKNTGKSVRIGISGVPGAGKSTFIESFGTFLTSAGHKVAVLAVDPTSSRSRGSILGDKTRMEKLSVDKNAFIRPSPSGGTLGGVAAKTRETALLCEAAGYDVVIIETVGVGQSETAVKSMVDVFLLLMISGAGDELQGIKRGIMEMADLFLIAKADGRNVPLAEKAKSQLVNALSFFMQPLSGVKQDVLTCSAIENKGIDTTWSFIESFISQTRLNGYFQKNRMAQSLSWIDDSLGSYFEQMLSSDMGFQSLRKKLEKKVINSEISPLGAVDNLINYYLTK